MACGAFHTMALTAEGMAYAWGSGKDGKLGLGEVAYLQLQPLRTIPTAAVS